MDLDGSLDALDGLEEATKSSYDPTHLNADAELRERFNLLASLVSTPDQVSKGAREYNVLERLITRDLLALAEGIGYPGESALYANLLDMLDDLREVVEFPYLANKNILAVGGEFSAGKSMFLNAIFGIDGLLPTGVNPTTSIPTYLTYAEEESIRAFNTFYRTQMLTRQQLMSISHAFNETTDLERKKISFYHILRLLQVQSPLMKWHNIAFLDTPGYSKPHVDGADEDMQGAEAGNTDEEKAKQHLSAADHLIWIVSAKDGTFRQQGIEFLRDKVKWRRPLYLLVSRADSIASSEERKAVYEQICQDARNAGFKLAGTSAYSAVERMVYFGDDPRSWFDAVDAKRKYTQWRCRFKELLNPVIAYHTQVKEHCDAYDRLLKRVRAKGEDFNEEEMRQIRTLSDSIVHEKKRHEASIRPFIAFCEKVEKQVLATLNAIGISDETAADVGVTATVSGDAKLLTIKKGDHIEGTIEVYSKWTGCFIRSDVSESQICIRRQDCDRVTDPKETFKVGRKVDLVVYEVSFKDKSVIFQVNFL